MIEDKKVDDSSLHPRDEHGRFSEKGVMELTEAERQKLLDYLENEKYIDYKGIHVSERKIDNIQKGKYTDEVKACLVLIERGFEVYLLDEQYTRSDKADIFFKNGEERDFMELKETIDKITTQYNRSVSQSPNCLITVTGYFSKIQKKNLIDAVSRNKNAKNVYVYLEKEKQLLKIK